MGVTAQELDNAYRGDRAQILLDGDKVWIHAVGDVWKSVPRDEYLAQLKKDRENGKEQR